MKNLGMSICLVNHRAYIYDTTYMMLSPFQRGRKPVRKTIRSKTSQYYNVRTKRIVCTLVQ